MNPRTDLCDKCQQFRRDLHSCSDSTNQERNEKKFAEHRRRAKLERDYYNKNTKLAKEQRKLVEKNYLLGQGTSQLLIKMGKGKVEKCSVDATAHYSHD